MVSEAVRVRVKPLVVVRDLSDLNSDGRLDKREFAIACHLISTQVKKQGPLPATLPPTLLSDAMMISTNGVTAMPTVPLYITRKHSFDRRTWSMSLSLVRCSHCSTLGLHWVSPISQTSISSTAFI